MTIDKTIRIGTRRLWGEGAPVSVFCKIELREDGRLSITGVEGPRANGNCAGSCGQIVGSLTEPGAGETWEEFAPGWTRDLAALFLTTWERWHLNDTRAGSAVQEEFLRANPLQGPFYPVGYYEKACEALVAAGLHPDADGYRYGSAWKREEVPAEVVAFLAGLPVTDRQPAWV